MARTAVFEDRGESLVFKDRPWVVWDKTISGEISVIGGDYNVGYTLGNLIDRILRTLKEDTTDPKFWTRVEILDYCIDGIRTVAETTNAFRFVSEILLPAETRIHYFPEGFLSCLRIEFDDKRIDPTTTDEMDQYDPNWRNKEGDPELYIQDIADAEQFEIFKLPDVDKTVTIYYVGYPDIILIDAEETDILPFPFFLSPSILEHYAVARALAKEGETQNIQKSQLYAKMFVDAASSLGWRKKQIRKSWIFSQAAEAASIRKHPKLPSGYPDYL